MALCHNTVRHFCHSQAKEEAFLLSLVPRVLSLPPSKEEERFVFPVPFYPVMAFYHVCHSNFFLYLKVRLPKSSLNSSWFVFWMLYQCTAFPRPHVVMHCNDISVSKFAGTTCTGQENLRGLCKVAYATDKN